MGELVVMSWIPALMECDAAEGVGFTDQQELCRGFYAGTSIILA